MKSNVDFVYVIYSACKQTAADAEKWESVPLRQSSPKLTLFKENIVDCKASCGLLIDMSQNTDLGWSVFSSGSPWGVQVSLATKQEKVCK